MTGHRSVQSCFPLDAKGSDGFSRVLACHPCLHVATNACAYSAYSVAQHMLDKAMLAGWHAAKKQAEHAPVLSPGIK